MTAMIAVGMVVTNLREDGLSDFCLGALTALIVAGLVQQIVRPPLANMGSSLARRGCLGFILICLAMAIYRTQHPYIVPDPNLWGDPQEYELGSVIAHPLWIFSLLLGSLTAPWMAAPMATSRHPLRRIGLTASSLALFLLYVGCVVTHWLFIPMLVDLAVQGVRVGMHQGAAVDTPHFVQWFGRTPQQWRAFVEFQVFSWPLLLLALVVTVWRCQSNDRLRASGMVTAVVVISLSIPAAINGVRLLGGVAEQIFPEFVTTFWELPRPDLIMVIWPLLLVAMYLATRRVAVHDSRSTSQPNRVYSSDHPIVGWMFVAIGTAALVDHFAYVRSLREFYETALELLGCLSYPEYGYPLFLLPFGLCWLWRRRGARECSRPRWPQVQSRQLWLFPCVLGLLIAVIALCIPFGLAMYHFGL